MRWLIGAVIVIGLVGFVVRSQYMGQRSTEVTAPVEMPVLSKTEIQSPTPDEKKVEPPAEIVIAQKLKESKPILQEKAKLRQEVASDPHGAPAAIMQAGQALGEIAELEEKYPERKAEFVAYYKDCYESSETMTVTRVQCFRRYVQSAKLSAMEAENALGSLPAPVRKLYERAEATR